MTERTDLVASLLAGLPPDDQQTLAERIGQAQQEQLHRKRNPKPRKRPSAEAADSMADSSR